MALPKKGFRPITINGTLYKYKVAGDDHGIRFIIGLPNINGQLLIGYISYRPNFVSNFNEEGIANSWNIFQRLSVTPDTIREVILYGLKNNWKPEENLKELILHGIEDKIKLQLKTETIFPNLKNDEVAVVFQSLNKWLNTNFTPYYGHGNIYHTLENIQIAKKFSQSLNNENNKLCCWILSDFNQALIYVDKNKTTNFKLKRLLTKYKTH